MVATFAIEIALAIFVAIRQRPTTFRTVVIALLVCLAVVQMAEFTICVGPASSAFASSKIGLIAITLLPALGMHLIGTVTRKSFLISIGYGCAIVYAVTFLLVPGAAGKAVCEGNYVIFKTDPGPISWIYEFYYMFFVLLAMLELVLRLVHPRRKRFPLSRRLVTLTLVAYLSFTVPMATVAILDASLRKATPSIMCGFALAFALILALGVSPLYTKDIERASAN